MKYYKALKVSPTATQKEIKSAYYLLSKSLHPDLNPDPKAHEEFLKITQAYSVLGDPLKRKEYDLSSSIPNQTVLHRKPTEPFIYKPPRKPWSSPSNINLFKNQQLRQQKEMDELYKQMKEQRQGRTSFAFYCCLGAFAIYFFGSGYVELIFV